MIKKQMKFIIFSVGILLIATALAIVGKEFLKTEVSEGSVTIEDPVIHVEVFAARRGPIHKWMLGEGDCPSGATGILELRTGRKSREDSLRP